MNKSLKVAYLLGSLNRGGTENLLLDSFRNAYEAGFSFIGIHRKGGSLLSSFKETGVPFYRVSFRNRFDLGYFLRLRKILISQSITIAHAQQPIDALLAFIATRGTGIRVVLTMHGYDFDEGTLPKIINRFILNRTALNIYVSKTQMNHYIKKFKLHYLSRQKVVYNGISFVKPGIPASESIIKEFGITNNTLLLCSVGNFVSVRDQMTICRFLALLIKKTNDFRMIFAGARDTRNPYLYDDCVSFCQKEGLNNHVTFLGSRSDVSDILNQSDVFIYSSDHDTFGIAVVEAIAAGIPVFVNDWEVINEITEEGRYANLYKTKNETSLYEIFQKFLENRDPFLVRAEEAALWARNSFSIERHRLALRDAYYNLI